MAHERAAIDWRARALALAERRRLKPSPSERVTMTLDEIKELIEFIKSHDLNEFELEQDGVKIRIKGGSNHHQVVAAPHVPAAMPMMAAAPMAPASGPGRTTARGPRSS